MVGINSDLDILFAEEYVDVNLQLSIFCLSVTLLSKMILRWKSTPWCQYFAKEGTFYRNTEVHLDIKRADLYHQHVVEL